MSLILWQILVVLVLTLLNGFFALSEIALISIRKTRVTELVKQGNKRAKTIQLLHKNPESLFATIQVGVSVVTIFASAFAGATIAEHLVPYISGIPIEFVAGNAYNISFVLVVALVTYLSLILGELVPKSLGLRYAETFSLYSAYPIWLLSKIISWPIVLLTASSNLILKLFKDSTSFTEGRLSEGEIRALLAEGRKSGSIEAEEHNIIENVFDLSDLNVEKIMIPRADMVAIDSDEPVTEIINKAIESGYSRIPMFQGNIHNIIGVLYTKKLLATINHETETLDLKNFLVSPYFVPGAMKIGNVLRLLQKKKAHLALVTDEHGDIQGLVTLEDILEEIVGEITDETDEVSQEIKRIGNDFLVAGNVSIIDFNKYFQLQLPEEEDFNTVSGFILDQLGHFPNAGESVAYQGTQFLVKEAAMRTVKTVLLQGIKRNQ